MKPTAYIYKDRDKDMFYFADCKLHYKNEIPLYAIPTDKDGNPTHKLVPIEPTKEMIKGALKKHQEMLDSEAGYMSDDVVCESFYGMIEAAPKIENI